MPPDQADLNADEKALAADYLKTTGEKFLEILMGLSETQWNFKPGLDRWSIREIAEHVVIVEKRIQGNVDKMADAPPAGPDHDCAQVDKAIFQTLPTRARRVEAPPFLHPTGQFCRGEVLQQFLEARARSLELLNSAPCLRGRVITHPIAGAWDGYQWLLATAGHSARHTEQILEVTSAPDFPQS